MRKIIALAVILLLAFSSLPALAVMATSYTYTLDENHEYIRTQDAYLPVNTITELGLSKPEDICFAPDGTLCIADTGNARILLFDTVTATAIGELKYSGFRSPKGVYVTAEGDIYVSDPAAKAVFRFDKTLAHVQTFTRPDSPVFADTNFQPMKVAVDGGGSLYIVSEGVYSGVIQLAPTGEFLGYFAVNKSEVTLSQMIQRMFYTREQLANLNDIVPTTFSNVFVDGNGIVYTTTMGTEVNGLKKHNTQGGSMFVSPVYGYTFMSDVYVDSQGLIYVANNAGYIDIYSPSGELVFEFGSYITSIDIAGLFKNLPALAVAANGDIWAVDSEKGYLQSFTPTEYARTVYSAMDLYEKGFYDESLEKWTKALRLNQMSILAHDGVGKALFHAGRYAESLEHFEVAGDRTFYSEAFWEVRNEKIQLYLPYVVGGFMALFVLSLATKKWRRKRFAGAGGRVLGRVMNARGLRGVLFMFKTARHPFDAYYDMREYNCGSVAGATFIYALTFVVFMLYQTSKGFIYQLVRLEDIDISALAGGYFIIIAAFIVFNWLVSSINDGDGTFKQLYKLPAYALAPALFAMAVNLGLSYVVTGNEAFLLSIVEYVGYIWSAAVLFSGLMVIHDYTFKETIKSIALTALFMLLAVVVLVMVIIMIERLYQFLGTLVEEAYRNALE